MKLVVVDIDGTLIDSPAQKVPSDEFVKVVQQIKDDVLVTCATGRSESWAKPVLEKAGFTAPSIIGGGALILDSRTLKAEHEYLIPQEQLKNIKNIVKTYPDSRVLFNDYTEQQYLSGGWEIQTLLDSDHCYILEIVDLSHELADELVAQFVQLVGVTSVKMNSLKPGFIDIHILNELATKEHAIGVLQQELGISKENTIGIGDGHNDFHIFKAVGKKIAVDNAVPELKELADEVIGGVKSDPVTAYLKTFRRG